MPGAASQSSKDHRKDGLVQTGTEIVALKNKGWATLGGTQVGVGKQNQNDITAPSLHRRWRLPGGPNPRRMSSGALAGLRPVLH